MGTPVYQAAHGFRRGDAIRKDTATQKWVAATAAWDAVVSGISDRSRFEIQTDGVLEDLSDLVIGETTYSEDGTTPIYRALSETTALLLPAASATDSSGESTGGGTTVVNNITNVTNVTEEGDTVNNITEDLTAVRRGWMGM